MDIEKVKVKGDLSAIVDRSFLAALKTDEDTTYGVAGIFVVAITKGKDKPVVVPIILSADKAIDANDKEIHIESPNPLFIEKTVKYLEGKKS